MFKFNLPRPKSLNPLLEGLVARDLDVYLYGYLPGSQMVFVDIDWKAAEQLASSIPNGWTLIYPFFMSSDAIAKGEADPLLQGVAVADILANYKPQGMTEQQLQANSQALVEQAEYLMQYPPSRLVWLHSEVDLESSVFELLTVIDKELS